MENIKKADATVEQMRIQKKQKKTEKEIINEMVNIIKEQYIFFNQNGKPNKKLWGVLKTHIKSGAIKMKEINPDVNLLGAEDWIYETRDNIIETIVAAIIKTIKKI